MRFRLALASLMLAAAAAQPAPAPAEACDALAAHPFDPDRPAGVAGVLLGNMDADAALAACEAALAAAPGQRRLVFQYGRALQAAGRADAAREHYRAAAEQGAPVAMVNLAQALLAGDGGPADPAAGLDWLRRAADGGLALAMTALGALYEDGTAVAQDDAQALAWYRRAAALDDPSGQNALAFMLEAGRGTSRDEAEAERLWRAAAARDFPDALNNLAWLLIGRGQGLDEALRHATRALELVPDSADFADTVGTVLLRQGWPAQALTYARAALDQRPDDPVFLEHAGDALWALERAGEARALWRRALEHAEPDQRPRLEAKLAR